MTHNKANKSKMLALILGLTMCLALMLGIVFASPTSTVYAEGGTGTTGGLIIDGESDMSGDGYFYEGKTQTLTLQNYNGKEIMSSDLTIKTIKVEGNNTITVDKTSKPFDAFGYSYYVGIGSLGAITITGSGSLAINVDKTDMTNQPFAIWTYGDLTINGGNITIGKDIDNGRWEIGLHSENGSISVVGEASLDVTATYTAINASSGKTTLAGKGNKKILINKEGKNYQAYGIYAGSGEVDISGVDSPDKGKVTCLFSNSGGNVDTAISAKKQIKIHSKADVEVSEKIRSNFANSSGIPAVEISDSKVKTTAIDVGTTSFIKILDSNVTAINSSNSGLITVSQKLEIAGKSTVYFSSKKSKSISPATEEILFQLSDGGSITMESNDYYANEPSLAITLGAGTVMETGIKGDELIEKPGTWRYGFQYKNPAILRFVHSATSPASAIADDVTISGITDAALTEQDIKLTLTGDNFKAIAKDTDVTAWFKNMPKGLSAKVKADVAAGATEMTITISGAPTEASSAFILIEIPVGTLQTATYSLIVQTTNIKFDIVSGTPVDIPTAATGLVYDGAVKTGISEPTDKSYTVTNGSAINAGTHTATLTLNKGFKWADGSTEPKTVTWEIARMPDVEIEVTLTQTEYEYTGLEISAYFTITIKGTDKIIDKSECDISYTNNKEVGEATVKIEDNGKGNYAIKNTVTKNFTIKKRTTGEPTGLTGIAPSADGAKDGKITGTTVGMEYSTDTEFTSPKPCGDGETAGLAEGTYYVRYKATATTAASNWVAVHVRLNTVTVVDGDGTKVTKHKSGTNVTVTVTIPTGKSFIKWVYEGVTIPTEDVTKQEIAFTMPEKDVKLTALFDDIIYNITVTNGTSSAPTAKYQEEVTVTANAPATGKEFDKWVVSGITLTNEDLAKSTVTFRMPASNVTMEATYKDVVYQVTVTNGTATPEMAKYQTEVTVKANEPAPDMYFDKWEVTGLDTTGMDLTKTEIKFPMPAGNVTFKATYRAIEKFAIEMVDGTKDKEVAKAGETVTITANPAPTGKVFDKWTCETAGVTIVFESATSSTTTFVMPASNIKIQAHFRAVDDKPSVEIKVEGGTGAGTYTQGESVTVTAEDKDGKEFVGWKDESGKIVSTNKSYTFTVTEATTLTAVYEDKSSGGGEITPPAKKDGLSGGAIAGIVIGSVAVAGIGGFAIYWFAISKKTFADLGVALKKVFTAIGNFFKTLGAKIKALFTKKK